MLWGIFALIAGLTYCVQTEINKSYKVGGFKLNTFRSLIAALLMIPLIPLMEWPETPEYYLVVLAEAAVSVVCMMAQYNLAARHNGRIACLHQPISLMMTFVIWLTISESQRIFLIDNPVNAACIALAFFIFIASIQHVRNNDTSWSALMAVIPIAVLYSVMIVVSKIALEHGESLFNISLNFVFLCNIFMFLISIPVYYSQKNNMTMPDAHTLKAAGYVAIFHTISWVAVCVAVILTPNPAYVSVITGLAPIWFMIYYKIRGIKDDASPVSGLFMAVAAIIVLIAGSKRQNP